MNFYTADIFNSQTLEIIEALGIAALIILVALTMYWIVCFLLRDALDSFIKLRKDLNGGVEDSLDIIENMTDFNCVEDEERKREALRIQTLGRQHRIPRKEWEERRSNQTSMRSWPWEEPEYPDCSALHGLQDSASENKGKAFDGSEYLDYITLQEPSDWQTLKIDEDSEIRYDGSHGLEVPSDVEGNTVKLHNGDVITFKEEGTAQAPLSPKHEQWLEDIDRAMGQEADTILFESEGTDVP